MTPDPFRRRLGAALFAFLALPGLVAFVAPLLIARRAVREGSFNAVALIFLVPGIALLLWCVRTFFVAGKGTLAPWDPPKELVSSGPYRVSRNPMYVAVGVMLLGWAVGFGSWALLVYALVVVVAFNVRVVFGEEPWLARTHRRKWDDYVRRVPRWLFPSRRAVWLSWAGAVVLLLLGGLTYEAYADAEGAREFPPPGTMVDIGGRRLHLVCIGRDDAMDPTIVFVASGWGNALSSSSARERLASRTRVCSYDRLGYGWSDAASGAMTIGAAASELGVLQDRAKLAAPFVVVASSIGGLTAEMFARTYPERVAGLVFVDAATSLLVPRLVERQGTITTLTCAAGVLARFGVIRLLDPFGIHGDSEGARRSAALTYGAKPWSATCALSRELSGMQREFEQAAPLSAELPVVALSASSTQQLMPPFAERFIDVARARADIDTTLEAVANRAHGTWKVVPESTHLIGDSQPDAVADAVFDLLDTIRGTP